MKIAQVIERVRNTPKLARDTTAVVACIAVGLSCIGWLVSGQKWQAPWQERYTFNATFEQAPGVRPESPQEVRIAGVEVGRITDANPTDDGNANLELTIDPDQTVYDNAKLVLRTKSPINVMYVALDPGGPPGKPLPSGGTIPLEQTETVVQPYEVFDKLDGATRASLTALINETDVALAAGGKDLAEGLDGAAGALDSFAPVLDKLDTRRQSLARLVTAISRVSTAAGKDDERLARLTRSLSTTLDSLAGRDDDLSRTLDTLPGMTSALRTSMAGLGDLTTEVDPVLDDLAQAAPDLHDALGDLTGTVRRIDAMANKARPVVSAARPLVHDLRPLAGDLVVSLANLRGLSAPLPTATQRLVPWMEDLAAFVYQTSSSFSLHDVNGGIARANLTVDVTNPTAGLSDVGIPQGGGR